MSAPTTIPEALAELARLRAIAAAAERWAAARGGSRLDEIRTEHALLEAVRR